MISLNLATIINMLECQGNEKKRGEKKEEKKIMKKKVKKNERKRKRKKIEK